MTAPNIKALWPACRKAAASLSRWIQKIDQRSRRSPWMSAFVLALTGLMLIWLVNREAG